MLCTALLALSLLSPPHANPAQDCVPSGHQYTDISRGAPSTDCVTTSYEYVCPDGSVIWKTTKNCETYRLVTEKTTQFLVNEEGEPCPPPLVTYHEYYEHVGSSSEELGEVCEGQGDCCVVTSSSWKYETTMNQDHDEWKVHTESILCPDGQKGTKTTRTNYRYRKRRVVSCSSAVATGNCPPEQSECPDVCTNGPWVSFLLGTESWVSIDCPPPAMASPETADSTGPPMASGVSIYAPRQRSSSPAATSARSWSILAMR